MQELLDRIAGLEGVRHPVVVTDVTGGITYWNAAATELLGWNAAEAVGRRLSDLLALPTTPEELLQRLDHDPDWAGETALRKKAGTAFLARLHQVAVTDEAGSVDGILRVIADITDATWDRRRERERGERAVAALAAAGVGSWHIDLATGLATWDETMERLSGLGSGTFPGSRRGWLDTIHPDDREWVVEEIRRLAALGDTLVDITYRLVPHGDETTWLQCLGRTFTTGGEATAVAGVAFDITERRRADEERSAFLAAERARRDRFTLLAAASAAFAESLEEEEVYAAVARLAVPRLADWLAIDVAGPAGVRTVAAVHSDTSRQQLLTGVDLMAPGTGIVDQVADVVADGRPRLVQHTDHASAAAGDAPRQAALAAAGLRSLMVVPLTARGRTFGAMTFAVADSDLTYSPEDLDLAADLGRRAALSIDNARLFADRTQVARVLQSSLLPPELPHVPGVTLAARYRAAVAGSDIGGDFYDVFQTDDRRWTIVLGDVSGKGTDAAVLTGLARHTLRAAAIGAERPRDVLAALNHAVMAPEYGERFVTLAYVQMSLAAGGAHLLASCAGHPSPLIARGDGTVEDVPATGGLIGLFPDVEISETPVELHPGDLLVLYTDGVLEARSAEGAFFGEARLQALLEQHAAAAAETVADAIESAVIEFQDGSPRDDIAVLVARLDDPALAQETR